MSEPRIRYDIEASTTGQADVAALGKAMAGLDDSLPPGLQERARDLAREIQELGKARVAVVEFERLGKAARDANSALDQSQSKFDALRREIEKSGTSTQVQNGQLQKLSDALRTAKTGAEGAEQALAQARGRLEQFGQAGTKLSETGVALKSIDKMAESAAVGVRGLTTEVERIRNGQQAVQALEGAFKTLGIQGVRGAEAEIVKLRNAVAQIKLADPFSPEVQRATAAANARIAELRGTLGGVPPAAAGAAAGMRSVASSSDTAAAALGSAAHKAIAWTAAITGIGSASDVVRNVVATGSAFEDLRVRLEQLLGGTEKAAAAFDLIKNLARNTPFEVKDLTEAYVRLTSFGLKPTEQQLMALADTAAVAGGGTEKLQRVTLALGQAWTKSKLQGDEILQLAEAGVPVWDLLAKATGRNVVELQKLSSEGALGRDVILKLFDALGQHNAGASARLMQTFSGTVSNARDAMAEFFDLISRSGVLEYLTQQLQGALAEFDRLKDSGELQIKAQAISDALIGVAEAAKVGFAALEQLAKIAPLVAAGFAGGKVLDFAAALRTAALASVTAGAQLSVAAGAAGAAGAAAATAAGSVTLLGRAMSLLGKIGIAGAVLGVVELGFEFFRAKKAAEDGDEAVRKMLAGPPEGLQSAKKAVRDLVAELDDFKKKLPGLQNDLAGLSGAALAGAATATIENLRAIKAESSDMSAALLVISQRAAQALGIDLPGAASKASDALEKAKAEAELLIGQLPNLGLSAQQAGAVVSQALGKMLDAAKTERDFVLVGEAIKRMEVAAKIGPGAVAELMDKAKAKAKDLQEQVEINTPGIQNLGEAARKAGVDVELLTGGITKSGKESITTVRDLVDEVIKTGVSAETASPLLAAALNKRIEASKTKEEVDALRAVIERATAAGKLFGSDLASALENAKKKADDLKTGINSVAEAYRLFGIKTKAELEGVAAKAKQAFDLINADPTTSLAIKQQAFKQYAEAAIAANEGVATSTIETQAAALKLGVDFDTAGKAIVKAMDGADGAIVRTKKRVNELGEEVNAMGERINALASGIGPSQDGVNFGIRSPGGKANEVNGLTPIDSFGNLIRSTPNGGITRTSSGQLDPPDNSGDWFFNTARRGEGPFGLGVWELKPEAAARRSQAAANPQSEVERVRNQFAALYPDNPNFRPPVPQPAPAPTPLRAPAAAPATAAPGGTPIVFNFGPRSYSVIAPGRAEAEALARELERLYQVSGGG